ncbi:MAG: low temperature requirement protein A [Spirochaetaceae bacterium]|nr:low temperature requirement protein A [Spirochaetaceae bacterium]
MKVKEKKVELIELFYDLIYVYALSKLTMLIEEPENGVIPFAGFFRYLVVCFVILQAWLYLTNYVNRYGRWKWYEYGLTAVNMTAAVYMANTINTDWGEMATTFNLAMLVMLLCVAVMYFIQIRLNEQDTGAARNMLTILTVDLFLYLVAFLASVIHPGQIVLWIDVAAVLVGAFLPFFIRGRFDISIISFPHLVERFELITIITFGEGIVGMTGFFDVKHVTLRPILVFAVILCLFGCYVTQIHYLCNHHRVDRSLRLMFSHYFIVIAVNLITVAFKFLENPEASHLFTAGLMIAALILFFAAIFSDSIYYHEKYRFGIKDAAESCGFLVIGAAVMLLVRSTIYGFLIGALITACGNFVMLLMKYKGAGLNENCYFDGKSE